MKIYIIGSGGGHTGYAVAIGESLIDLEPELDLVFVLPTRDMWSLQRLRSRIRGFEYIHVVKPRRPLESMGKVLLLGPRSLFDSLKFVKEPFMVIATGSNHGIAPVLAGLFRRARCILSIEAIDRIYTYSKANMLLYKCFKTTILLQWKEQKKYYPRGVLVGPIYERPIYNARDEDYILVLSGSMGHKKLFDLLLKTDLENVVIQTGKIDPEYIISRKPHWKAFKFDPDIDRWIAGASVVIGHQGLSIAEAALAYNKPVIIAYNPDLPQTSGYLDSLALAKKLNGLCIDVGKISPQELTELIDRARKRKPPKYVNGSYVLARTIIGMLYK